MKRFKDKVLRLLGRDVTILIIPHTNLPLWRARFTLHFLLVCAVLWSGLTIMAGYLAGRSLDYWVTKADNQVMRAKMYFMASEMEKSHRDLERALKTDQEMRVLLGMGTRRAIIESGEAVGGPAGMDRLNLIERIRRDPLRVNASAIRQSLRAIRAESQRRLSSFQEIAWHISHKRSLHRYTPSGPPVEGRVTSQFGYRFSPVSRGDESETGEFHSGVDISNKLDSPIAATADGVVREAGWMGGYGLAVLVRHDWGYSTLYGHNAKLLVGAGDAVRRGQAVALLGMTGRTTGPHVHYEVWHHGRPVNPVRFMRRQAEDDLQVR